jgi:hypothetical protein
MRIRQLVPKLTKVEQTVEINIIDGLFNFWILEIFAGKMIKNSFLKSS